MLTRSQIKWLSHLSDADKVRIFPHNPKSEELFERQKIEIQNILGLDVEVVHRGSTSLGISGQSEVDVYIPVSLDWFDKMLDELKKVWGEPGSYYPKERARFNRYQDGIKMEVFLINQDCKGWIQGIAFESYLKSHPKVLEKYRKLKEEGDGLSGREYYRRKLEFFNDTYHSFKLDKGS